jgi:hypothetical protein
VCEDLIKCEINLERMGKRLGKFHQKNKGFGEFENFAKSCGYSFMRSVIRVSATLIEFMFSPIFRCEFEKVSKSCKQNELGSSFTCVFSSKLQGYSKPSFLSGKGIG